MAYATVDEKTFYIQGGSYGIPSGSNQFFALDLQTSWTSSNVPWKALSTGYGIDSSPAASEHWMALSNGNLTVYGWNGFYKYSLTS
ncbi:hypothetical protein BGX26_010731, partial [Mortierella sp. AD094]